MNSTLKNDKEHIAEILQHTVRIAKQHYEKQHELQPSHSFSKDDFKNLPETGSGGQAVLDLFQEKYAAFMANSAGPRYFGFVTGGSTPASVAGDWLVSVYDQVMSGSNDSAAHFIERETLHFLKQLFLLDPTYFGTFVTGATMSNFVSLATARQWIGEQRGVNFSEDGVMNSDAINVVSASPHSSILKSMSMLGLGRKSWVKINTLDNREAIDVAELETYLEAINEPVIVVANAGTVNTVDFDDLNAIGALKKKYNFWLHVDAAFGGFAACSEKYKAFMHGINEADSITIDAHKWLNVPYDAAMQFTRHKNIQVKVFQNQAAYLGDPELMPDSMHFTPENSRRFRALPAWFSLMAYGKEGYREIVERNCFAAAKLGEKINESPDFRLLAPVRMNVVCFTFRQNEVSIDEIRSFLNAVRDDGRVFFTPTVYKGTAAIRAAISNWQTEEKDLELAFEVLTKVYGEAVAISR